MKNQSIIKTISVLVVLFFSTTMFAGGPWPQLKNKGYIKISEWWIISNQHYTDQGRIDPNVTSGLFNTSIYAEYGFSDRITGVVYFPFLSISYFNNTVSGTTGDTIFPGELLNSLGDADIGLNYKILDGPLALSASVTFGLPIGNEGGGSLGTLQTGDGEFNQLLQLNVGTGFNLGDANAYASAYIGYNNRTKGFSDEIRYGIEAGVTLFDNRLTAIARLYGIQSRNNGVSGQNENSSSIFANNSEHLTIGPELAYSIGENWGVSAGFGTAVSGKLIFAATSYNVGVFFKI